MSDVTIPHDTIIEARILLREFDALSTRIQSRDVWLDTLDAMQARINKMFRDFVK